MPRLETRAFRQESLFDLDPPPRQEKEKPQATDAGARRPEPENREAAARSAVWSAVSEALGLLHPGQVDAMLAAATWIAEPAHGQLETASDPRIQSLFRNRALCAAAFWSIGRRAPGKRDYPTLERLEELRRAGLLGRIPPRRLREWADSGRSPDSLLTEASETIDVEWGASSWNQMAHEALRQKPTLPERAVIGLLPQLRDRHETVAMVAIDAAARVIANYSPAGGGALLPYWRKQADWRAMRSTREDIRPSDRSRQLASLFKALIERGRDPAALDAFVRRLRGSYGVLFGDEKEIYLVRDAFKSKANRRELLRSAKNGGVTLEQIVRIARSAGVLRDAIADARGIVRGDPQPAKISIETPTIAGEEKARLGDTLSAPEKRDRTRYLEEAALDLAMRSLDEPKIAVALCSTLSGQVPSASIGPRAAALLHAAAGYFQRKPMPITPAELVRSPESMERAGYALCAALRAGLSAQRTHR